MALIHLQKWPFIIRVRELNLKFKISNCQDFHIGKTKRRLHDRKTEHFKGITSSCHASAIADHVTSTGHNLKWDHFEILAKGRSDTHCKIKETLLIQELKPTLNDTVSSEKLYLYRGIHADVIVYIFAHLHTTLHTEENLLDVYWLQATKELVQLKTWLKF